MLTKFFNTFVSINIMFLNGIILYTVYCTQDSLSEFSPSHSYKPYFKWNDSINCTLAHKILYHICKFINEYFKKNDAINEGLDGV